MIKRLLWVVLVCAGCSDSPSKNVVWEKTDLDALPGFHDDQLHEVLPALSQSCACLKRTHYMGHNNQKLILEKEDWKAFCDGLEHAKNVKADVKSFLKTHLVAYKICQETQGEGTFTGYYEPLLFGSLKKHGKYQTPLYKFPGKNHRVSREKISKGALSGKKLELVWVSDPVDAFFLEIQGSGRVQLDNGKTIRLGYAGQNGYPYVAIGKILLDQGLMEKEKISMHSLKAWLRKNPKKAKEIMNKNPSYVFFKKLDIHHAHGPIGAQGVPLTPHRSMAVDTRYIPLGAPLWIDLDHPAKENEKIQKIVVAQDRGGAIKGIIRGDYFWGFGKQAEHGAGLMKSKGSYYLLLPKNHVEGALF